MFFYSLRQLLSSTCQASSAEFYNFGATDRWPAVHVPSFLSIGYIAPMAIKDIKDIKRYWRVNKGRIEKVDEK